MEEWKTMTMGEWFDYVRFSDDMTRKIDDAIIKALEVDE